MAEQEKNALVVEVHPPRWPETCKDEVEAILRRYPEGREQSAILPLLHLAMREREGRFVAQSDIVFEYDSYIYACLDVPRLHCLVRRFISPSRNARRICQQRPERERPSRSAICRANGERRRRRYVRKYWRSPVSTFSSLHRNND